MATPFNLTAQINLRGPTNIKPVIGQIKKQLGSINADVNVKLAKGAATSVANVTKNLKLMNAEFQKANTNAKALTTSLGSLSAAFNSTGKASLQISSSGAKVTSTLSATVATANETGEAMNKLGREVFNTGKRIAILSTLVTPLVHLFRNATSEAVAYNSQMTRLQQVVGGTGAAVKSISNEITRLSTQFGVASSELSNVAVTLAQAGFQAEDARKSLESLAKTSLAPTFKNIAQTTEGAIAAMRQFSIGANDLESALGSINSVAAKFAVESSDIIAAIQRTGGVFASASQGVSEGTDALNEFIAVFTSVRATTRESAETIATGLRTIFTRIQRGSTIKYLKDFGVELQNSQGKFVGAYEAIKRLSDGLKDLDPRDVRFSQIVEELGGFRQIGKVIPLIQNFTTAQQALKVAQQGQGSLTKDAIAAQKAYAVQITKVREEFNALIRDFSENSVFKNLAGAFLSITKNILTVGRTLAPIGALFAASFAIKNFKGIGEFFNGITKSVTSLFNQKDKGGFLAQLGSLTGGPSNLTVTAKNEKVTAAITTNTTALNNNTKSLDAVTTSVNALTAAIGKIQLPGKPATPNAGGFIQAFARGGVVPGSGNRDTVPAMLTPGEFVIRKNAVNTIGADRLHQMNKYAGGGKVGPKTLKKLNIGKGYLTPTIQEIDTAQSDIVPEYIQLTKTQFKTMFNEMVREEGNRLAQLEKFKGEFDTNPQAAKTLKKFRGFASQWARGNAFEAQIARQIPGANRLNKSEGSLQEIIDSHYAPLDFSEGDAKFVKNTRQYAASSENKARLAILSKRFRDYNKSLLNPRPTKSKQDWDLGTTKVYLPETGAKERFDDYVEEEMERRGYTFRGKKTKVGLERIQKDAISAYGVRQELMAGGVASLEDRVADLKNRIRAIGGPKQAVERMGLSGSEKNQTIKNLSTNKLDGKNAEKYIDDYEKLLAKAEEAAGIKAAAVQQDLAERFDLQIASILPFGYNKDLTYDNVGGRKVRFIARGLDTQYRSIVEQMQSESRGLAQRFADRLQGKQPTAFEDVQPSPLDEKMGQGNIEGAVLEKTLALLGAPVRADSRANRPIDYPDGLGSAAQYFPGLSSSVPTEVKRTIDKYSLEQSRKELARAFSENVFANGGEVASDKQLKFINSLLSQYEQFFGSKISAHELYSDPEQSKSAASNTINTLKKAIDQKDLAKKFDLKFSESWKDYIVTKLGTSITPNVKPLSEFAGDEALIAEYQKRGNLAFGSSFQPKRGLSQGSMALRTRRRFAEGGSAEDTVPALLTPGEFVINKESAARIGATNLNRLNRADKIQGFNKGGSVGAIQSFAAGGGVVDVLSKSSGLSPEAFMQQIKNAMEDLAISIQDNLGIAKDQFTVNIGKATAAFAAGLDPVEIETSIRETVAALAEAGGVGSASIIEKATQDLFAGIQAGLPLDQIAGSSAELTQIISRQISTSDALDRAMQRLSVETGIAASELNKLKDVQMAEAKKFFKGDVGKQFDGLLTKAFPKQMKEILDNSFGAGLAKFSKALPGPALVGAVVALRGSLEYFSSDIQKFGESLGFLPQDVADSIAVAGGVLDGAGQYGGVGAALGQAIAGPVGASIGAAVGAIGGGIKGYFDAQRRIAEREENDRFNREQQRIDDLFNRLENGLPAERAQTNRELETRIGGQFRGVRGRELEGRLYTQEEAGGVLSRLEAFVANLQQLGSQSLTRASTGALQERRVQYNRVGDPNETLQTPDLLNIFANTGVGRAAIRSAGPNATAEQRGAALEQIARNQYIQRRVTEDGIDRQVALNEWQADRNNLLAQELRTLIELENTSVSVELARRAQENYNKELDLFTRKMSALSQVFNVFNNEMEYSLARLDSLNAGLMGQGTQDLVLRDRTSDIINNPEAYSLREYQDAADRLGGQGPAGREISNLALTGRVIEQVLRPAMAAAEGRDIGDLEGLVNTQLENLFHDGDVPEQMRDTVNKVLEQVTTGVEDASGNRQLTGSFDELSDKVESYSQETKAAQDALKELAAQRKREFELTLSLEKRRADAILEQVNITQTLVKTQADFNQQLRDALGEVSSLEEMNAGFNAQIDKLTGGERDPSKIAARIEELGLERQSIQDQINNFEDTGNKERDRKEQNELARQFYDLGVEQNKYRKALEMIANSNETVANAFKKLADEQKRATASKDVLQTLASGSIEDIIKLQQDMAAVQAAVGGDAGFFAANPLLSKLNPQILDILQLSDQERKRAENTAIGGAIGGRFGPGVGGLANQALGMIDNSVQNAVDAAKAASEIQLRALEELTGLAETTQDNIEKQGENIDKLAEALAGGADVLAGGAQEFADVMKNLGISLPQAIVDNVNNGLGAGLKEQVGVFQALMENAVAVVGAKLQEIVDQIQVDINVPGDPGEEAAPLPVEVANDVMPPPPPQRPNPPILVGPGPGFGGFGAGFPRGRSEGGPIYAKNGAQVDNSMFKPMGKDTVPAMSTNGQPYMLQPGEFIVNEKSTKENLGLLRAINGGRNIQKEMARGGTVYAKNGFDPYAMAAGFANPFATASQSLNYFGVGYGDQASLSASIAIPSPAPPIGAFMGYGLEKLGVPNAGIGGSIADAGIYGALTGNPIAAYGTYAASSYAGEMANAATNPNYMQDKAAANQEQLGNSLGSNVATNLAYPGPAAGQLAEAVSTLPGDISNAVSAQQQTAVANEQLQQRAIERAQRNIGKQQNPAIPVGGGGSLLQQRNNMLNEYAQGYSKGGTIYAEMGYDPYGGAVINTGGIQIPVWFLQVGQAMQQQALGMAMQGGFGPIQTDSREVAAQQAMMQQNAGNMYQQNAINSGKEIVDFWKKNKRTIGEDTATGARAGSEMGRIFAGDAGAVSGGILGAVTGAIDGATGGALSGIGQRAVGAIFGNVAPEVQAEMPPGVAEAPVEQPIQAPPPPAPEGGGAFAIPPEQPTRPTPPPQPTPEVYGSVPNGGESPYASLSQEQLDRQREEENALAYWYDGGGGAGVNGDGMLSSAERYAITIPGYNSATPEEQRAMRQQQRERFDGFTEQYNERVRQDGRDPNDRDITNANKFNEEKQANQDRRRLLSDEQNRRNDPYANLPAAAPQPVPQPLPEVSADRPAAVSAIPEESNNVQLPSVRENTSPEFDAAAQERFNNLGSDRARDAAIIAAQRAGRELTDDEQAYVTERNAVREARDPSIAANRAKRERIQEMRSRMAESERRIQDPDRPKGGRGYVAGYDQTPQDYSTAPDTDMPLSTGDHFGPGASQAERATRTRREEAVAEAAIAERDAAKAEAEAAAAAPDIFSPEGAYAASRAEDRRLDEESKRKTAAQREANEKAAEQAVEKKMQQYAEEQKVRDAEIAKDFQEKRAAEEAAEKTRQANLDAAINEARTKSYAETKDQEGMSNVDRMRMADHAERNARNQFEMKEDLAFYSDKFGEDSVQYKEQVDRWNNRLETTAARQANDLAEAEQAKQDQQLADARARETMRTNQNARQQAQVAAEQQQLELDMQTIDPETGRAKFDTGTMLEKNAQEGIDNMKPELQNYAVRQMAALSDEELDKIGYAVPRNEEGGPDRGWILQNHPEWLLPIESTQSSAGGFNRETGEFEKRDTGLQYTIGTRGGRQLARREYEAADWLSTGNQDTRTGLTTEGEQIQLPIVPATGEGAVKVQDLEGSGTLQEEGFKLRQRLDDYEKAKQVAKDRNEAVKRAQAEFERRGNKVEETRPNSRTYTSGTSDYRDVTEDALVEAGESVKAGGRAALRRAPAAIAGTAAAVTVVSGGLSAPITIPLAIIAGGASSMTADAITENTLETYAPEVNRQLEEDQRVRPDSVRGGQFLTDLVTAPIGGGANFGRNATQVATNLGTAGTVGGVLGAGVEAGTQIYNEGRITDYSRVTREGVMGVGVGVAGAGVLNKPQSPDYTPTTTRVQVGDDFRTSPGITSVDASASNIDLPGTSVINTTDDALTQAVFDDFARQQTNATRVETGRYAPGSRAPVGNQGADVSIAGNTASMTQQAGIPSIDNNGVIYTSRPGVDPTRGRMTNATREAMTPTVTEVRPTVTSPDVPAPTSQLDEAMDFFNTNTIGGERRVLPTDSVSTDAIGPRPTLRDTIDNAPSYDPSFVKVDPDGNLSYNPPRPEVYGPPTPPLTMKDSYNILKDSILGPVETTPLVDKTISAINKPIKMIGDAGFAQGQALREGFDAFGNRVVGIDSAFPETMGTNLGLKPQSSTLKGGPGVAGGDIRIDDFYGPTWIRDGEFVDGPAAARAQAEAPASIPKPVVTEAPVTPPKAVAEAAVPTTKPKVQYTGVDPTTGKPRFRLSDQDTPAPVPKPTVTEAPVTTPGTTAKRSLTSRKDLPSVNRVGAELQDEFNLRVSKESRPGAFLQNDDNCLGIACRIANDLGFEANPDLLLENARNFVKTTRLNTVGVSQQQIEQSKMLQRWFSDPTRADSIANMIIRENDNAQMKHISFEAMGREYNFGPAEAQDWPIMMRIPLRRSQGMYNGGVIYANKGMMVPMLPKGQDTVPAMLSEGEYVVNRESAANNLDLLRRINNSRGPLYMNQGGMVSSAQQAAGYDNYYGTMGVNNASNQMGNNFANYVEQLQNISFPSIPERIEMVGSHTVDVNVNGAGAFESLQGGIQSMINSEIGKTMDTLWTQSNGSVGRSAR